VTADLKVSLIATVKDAVDDVGAFLGAIAAQTRQPDEVVIVDGGSTDGTLDILKEHGTVTVVEAPGANIARGRNLAVEAAAHDVIAVSDADCIPEPTWLERLLEPIARGADVAMGYYRPEGDSLLQVAAASVLPDPEELRQDRFMPSSRSVAFLRSAYRAGGGYPEWLDIGEDMFLDHAWRDLGLRMELVPDAIVRWRIRGTLGQTWRQYARYARGDAEAAMHPKRHALRFAVYGGAAGIMALKRRRWLLGAAAVAGAAYVSGPVRRAARRAPDHGINPLAAAAVTPALIAFIDAAKMTGYLTGAIRRRKASGRTAEPD
jgi:glycosyltransferase involved in cell wall biosynthesis